MQKINRLKDSVVSDDLNSVWDKMFTELCKFKKENKHCNVPKKYPENQKLSSWVGKQRMQYGHGKLSTIRIEKLNQVGFIWNTLHSLWEELFIELCEFKQKNGHCSVPKGHEKTLSNWISVQRNMFKKNKLSNERIERLEELGFVWDPISTVWEEMFTKLCQFKQEHGHSNIFKNSSVVPGLSNWVSHQRALFKKGALSPTRIQRLKDIGLKLDPYENQWEAMAAELCRFEKENGHCNVSQKSEENSELARWIGRQRNTYKRGLLNQERISRLEQLGLTWNVINDTWESLYRELVAFKNDIGHCNVPQFFPTNPKLGVWVAHQRDHYRQGKLLAERIDKLQKIGFCWDPYNVIREEMFKSLYEFQKENGHCNVPARYQKNMKLGRWIERQRQSYRCGKLSIEQKERFEKLGFVWNPMPKKDSIK
jgi:Helicase associated domain